MRKIKISAVIMAAGILLICASLALLVISQINAGKYKAEAARLADELTALMPEITEGYIYERSDYSMPTSEIGGKDYVGVLEIPLYSVKLPVAAKWDKDEIKKLPANIREACMTAPWSSGEAIAQGSLIS